MSINRGMDKEDVVHIYNGILLSHKKNEIMPFAATWMDQEIVILSEGSQTDRNVIQHPLIAESKKKRFPKKQKIDSWTWRMNIARGEGIVTEFGINM